MNLNIFNLFSATDAQSHMHKDAVTHATIIKRDNQIYT